MSFTVAQLEQQVWDQLDNNTGEFPEPNVRAVLSQGLQRLNNLVGFSQDTVPVPGFSVANQLLYARPAGILIPLRVDFEGEELEKTSLARIARRYRDFAVDTGKPSRWCLIGLRTFLIHPADPVGGGLLEVSGVAPIAKLGADTSETIDLDDEHAEILVDWAKFRLLLKEGGKSFSDASVSGYQAMISKAKTLALWESMTFPAYYMVKESNPGDGKGT